MKNTDEILKEIDNRVQNLTNSLQTELKIGAKHDKILCQILSGQIGELKDLKK